MKLFFLHGLGQGPKSWTGCLEALGPDTDAACPDLFGLCGNAQPAYQDLFAAFEEYMDAQPEPVCLCGLSLGAVLTLDYAIRHPQKAGALVLIAPQYKMPRTLLRVQSFLFRLMPERAFAQTGMRKEAMIRLTASMMPLDFREELSQVTCPALILAGEKDAANRKAARELAGLLPHGTLREIPGAGHEVNLEAPRELAEAVRNFTAETIDCHQ